jgi:hypothetical protein
MYSSVDKQPRWQMAPQRWGWPSGSPLGYNHLAASSLLQVSKESVPRQHRSLSVHSSCRVKQHRDVQLSLAETYLKNEECSLIMSHDDVLTEFRFASEAAC